MDNEKLKSAIPSNYIIKIIKSKIDPNFSIGVQYKTLLKECIMLFIYYITTYAEIIAEEKKVSKINNEILNEALMEIDFYEIIDQILEKKEGVTLKREKRDLESIGEKIEIDMEKKSI